MPGSFAAAEVDLTSAASGSDLGSRGQGQGVFAIGVERVDRDLGTCSTIGAGLRCIATCRITVGMGRRSGLAAPGPTSPRHCEAGGTQPRHDDLGLPHHAGGEVDDGRALAGTADQHLVASGMVLAHHRHDTALEHPAKITESRATAAAWPRPTILLPRTVRPSPLVGPHGDPPHATANPEPSNRDGNSTPSGQALGLKGSDSRGRHRHLAASRDLSSTLAGVPAALSRLGADPGRHRRPGSLGQHDGRRRGLRLVVARGARHDSGLRLGRTPPVRGGPRAADVPLRPDQARRPALRRAGHPSSRHAETSRDGSDAAGRSSLSAEPGGTTDRLVLRSGGRHDHSLATHASAPSAQVSGDTRAAKRRPAGLERRKRRGSRRITRRRGSRRS